MDIKTYLNRIKAKNFSKPTKEKLFYLQKQHLLHIPFENLDIHYGKTIELDLEAIYHKIILKNRGGFCYELNGLFTSLLNNLGFQANMISARVHTQNKEYGKEFDHMAILVVIEDNTYLCDVGFGNFTLEPLEFVLDKRLQDENGTFIFDNKVNGYYRVSVVKEGQWEPNYIFTTTPRNLSEFESMCHYHQTSDESHFTKKKVVSVLTKSGRITLNDTQLKVTIGSEIKLQDFKKREFETYLKKYFGMVVPT